MSNIQRLFVSLLLLLPLAGAAVADKFAIAADGDQAVAEIAKLAGVAPFSTSTTQTAIFWRYCRIRTWIWNTV